jgi:hypothetical protein
MNGAPCGTLNDSNFDAFIFLHELGHVIGLGDADPSACSNRLMRAEVGVPGASQQTVKAGDCEGARAAAQAANGSSSGGNSGGPNVLGGGNGNNSPVNTDLGHCFPGIDPWCTPLILDLDGYGGDGDGLISHRDAVWWKLALWVDANHDARSQKTEIFSLAEEGVVALGLDFNWSRQIDASGNGHFLQGLAVQEFDVWGVPAQRWMALHDVYFRLVP